MNIRYQAFEQKSKPVFSIIIPSWNNIELLQLCVKSIITNSKYNHQIIIHINEGIDGTLDWVNAQQINYTHSKENIGICYAVNAAVGMAIADYLVYINDDMYVCPDWDYYLLEEIKQLPNEYFYLSSTLIEPRFTNNNCVIAPYDFGQNVNEFEEEKLLKEYQTLHFHDWTGSSWPPSVVHKHVWQMVGGYSTEFSPGMYSDPDFSMKLWNAGVRYFKGINQSRVYHFMSKSTGKLRKKTNGKKQFLHKWGISARMFYRDYLRMGSVFRGELEEPKNSISFKLNKLKYDMKRCL